MEDYNLPINLLRQWCFCPRVVYYRELLGMKALEPLWSKQGGAYHQRETILFKRRNLSRFHLKEGIKHHNINLKNKTLRLHGISDLIIETPDRVFAVEYKLGKKVNSGHIMQLLAYALLAEKHFSKQASHGFILTGDGKLKVVEIDNEKREKLKLIVDKIFKMLFDNHKPPSDATAHQCGQCEYLNYCNDREV